MKMDHTEAVALLEYTLHHFIHEFYYLKGFFIVHACKKKFLRLQHFFGEMNESSKTQFNIKFCYHIILCLKLWLKFAAMLNI